MTDVHSKQTRSYNMSRIKSRNTKPELRVRRLLHGCGFRFRLHVKGFPGTPDIMLPKFKTVIFVHGCFWHGHDLCRYFKIPGTNSEWWKSKIDRNKKNDLKSVQELTDFGWNAIVIWECDIKSNNMHNVLSPLFIKAGKLFPMKTK
jgi:DNA mismatch endonuclease (patch repair protein)